MAIHKVMRPSLWVQFDLASLQSTYEAFCVKLLPSFSLLISQLREGIDYDSEENV